MRVLRGGETRGRGVERKLKAKLAEIKRQRDAWAADAGHYATRLARERQESSEALVLVAQTASNALTDMRSILREAVQLMRAGHTDDERHAFLMQEDVAPFYPESPVNVKADPPR